MGQAPGRPDPPRAVRNAGFTLLELALVLLITSVMLTLVLPRLPRLTATQLDASADRLAMLTTYLADESALRGRVYRLSLDLDENAWDVETMRPWDQRSAGTAAEPLREWDPYGRSGRLPDGVFFESVTSGDSQEESGRQTLWFLPEGAPADARVELGESGGRHASVVFDAASGHARVVAEEPPR